MKTSLMLILAAVTVFPQSKSLKPHVHGAAQINIAMDGLKGEVEFEAPADGVIGFESEAKTAAQKLAVEAALKNLRTRAAELVVFPVQSSCRMTPKEVDVHREGAQHSEVHAHYDLVCSKPITAPIRFGVTKLFPKTREVTVTLVTDQAQKSVKIVADAGTIQP